MNRVAKVSDMQSERAKRGLRMFAGRRTARLTLVALVALGVQQNMAPRETQVVAATSQSWKDLKPISYLCSDRSAAYYEFPADNGSKAHLIVFDLKSPSYELRPAVSTPTAPTSEALKRAGAIAAVNGGFFNLSNGESTSYVVIDGKQVADPKKNTALTGNPKLAPFLERIFNRSEVRFLAGKNGEREICIVPHNENIHETKKLMQSLQAGPQLLPRLTAEEEAFIRTEPDGTMADSIGCNKTAARTAFGITPEGKALLLCVAGKGQDEFSSGITLIQLGDIMRSLGCQIAINFDGGTSTTMAVKTGESGPVKVVCGREPETRVKSVLLIAPVKALRSRR